MADPAPKFERNWVLWEMWDQNRIDVEETSYIQKMQKICTFDNLDTFLYCWQNLPHSDPRQIFCERNQTHQITRKVTNDRTIEAIAVFEDGINPTWEDPINAEGSDFSVKLPNI
jgi:translation initiation factor 4E